MEEGKLRIERFDGKDFAFWKMQIEDYLYQKDLYQPLEGKKPETMKEEDWKVLDRKALGVVRLTLARSVAFNVKDETTTTGLMKALSSMYEKPSAVNKVYLMRRLFDLRMGDGSSAAEHINEFNSILSQLSSVEIKFDDEVRALILLSSLPTSWETVVAAISNSSGKEKLKSDDVRDLILSESTRRKDSGESSGEAYAFESRGRGRHQGGSASHHGRSNSRGSGRSNGAHVACWECGGEGHLKRNCPQMKKKKGKGKAQDSFEDGDASTNSVTEYDSDVLCVSSEHSMKPWVLDSGSSKKVSFVETSQVKGTHKGVVREKKAHKGVVGGGEMKNTHKSVVCENQAKGDVFGWEHGRSARRTRQKSQGLCGVIKGVKFGWEHGKSARRTNENYLGCYDVDHGLGSEETSVLLPW